MDHGAAAGLAHMRHRRPRRMHHGFEIDGEHLVPDAQIHVEQGGIAAEPQDAGDIGETVDPAEAFRGIVDGAPHEALVGEVALGRQRPLAIMLQIGRDRLDVDHRDGAAGLENAFGDRMSHATGRTRHHGGAAGEVEAHHHQLAADIAFSAAAIAAWRRLISSPIGGPLNRLSCSTNSRTATMIAAIDRDGRDRRRNNRRCRQ